MHRTALFATLAVVAATAQPALAQKAPADVAAKIEAAANGAHRSDENKARNQYRHPVDTLTFFGLKPTMTVVEISPGAGCPGTVTPCP